MTHNMPNSRIIFALSLLCACIILLPVPFSLQDIALGSIKVNRHIITVFLACLGASTAVTILTKNRLDAVALIILGFFIPIILFGNLYYITAILISALVFFALGYAINLKTEDHRLLCAGLSAFWLAWIIPSIMNYTGLMRAPVIGMMVIGTAGLALYLGPRSQFKWAYPAHLFTDQNPIADLPFNIFLAALAGLIGLIVLIPDNGSDSIEAYLSMFYEIKQYGHNVYNPAETSIGLLSLPGLWFNAFLALIAGEDSAALKLGNGLIFIASLGLALAYWRQRFSFIAAILALLVSTPLVLKILASNFVDAHAFAAVMVLAISLYHYFETDTPKHKYRVFLGLILGVTFLVKYTLYPIIIITALSLILFEFYKNRFKAIPNLIVIGLASIVPVLIFCGFVYFQSGNPLFPYYNTLFHSPWFPDLDMEGPHRGYLSWILFWDMMTKTPTYAVSGAVPWSLGFFPWLGFIAAIFTILKTIISPQKNMSAFIFALMFLAATIFLSAVENSDRYVYPYFVLAIPAIAIMLSSLTRTLSYLVVIGLLISQTLLLGQYGHGSTLIDFKKITEPNEPINSWTYNRQNLHEFFEPHVGSYGNYLVLASRGSLTGDIYQATWYDYLAYMDIHQELKKPSPDWGQFLDERNIDYILIQPKYAKRYAKMIQPLLDYLEAQSVENVDFGNYKIWEMPPNIRADEILSPKPVNHNDQSATYQINRSGEIFVEIELSCKGNGVMLIAHMNNGWKKHFTREHMCISENGFETIQIPLQKVEDATLHIQFKNFDVLTIKDFKAYIRKK